MKRTQNPDEEARPIIQKRATRWIHLPKHLPEGIGLAAVSRVVDPEVSVAGVSGQENPVTTTVDVSDNSETQKKSRIGSE